MISFNQFLTESRSLKNYTSSDDFSYYKGDIEDEFPDLVRKYPYSGGKLYRGINFRSAKEYLNFRRAIRGGTISSNTITSWSPDQLTAAGFAKSPQVFNVTSSVLSGYDPNERINGFVGAVIVITVRGGIGIDVNASPYGQESEVILPPGSYKIEDLIIEKKWKHIVNKLDINQEVIDIIRTSREVDNELMRQLFRYKGGDLYDDVKRQIVDHAVKSFLKKNYINLEFQPDPIRRWEGNKKEFDLLFPDGKYRFNLRGNLGMLEYFIMSDAKSYLTNQHRADIKRVIVNKVNNITKILDKKRVAIEYDRGISLLLDFFDLKLTDLKYLSRAYAEIYNRFNTLLREYNTRRHFDVGKMSDLLKDNMRSPF